MRTIDRVWWREWADRLRQGNVPDDGLAPGLLASESAPGFRSWWSRRFATTLHRDLLAQRQIEEWRRIAPGGSPLWMLPDAELEAMIDRLAASSRARTVEITYYLAEYDRRQQRRMNEEVARANAQMVRLTRAVAWLTGIVVVLTAVSTTSVILAA